MMAIIPDINGPADELAIRPLRNERGQVSSVIDEPGFVAGFLEENSAFAGSVHLDPFHDGSQLRAKPSAKRHVAANFCLKKIKQEGQQAADGYDQKDVRPGPQRLPN